MRIFLLAILTVFVWLIADFVHVLRLYRYEDSEIDGPLRRQNRYTGRVQVWSKAGWK